MADETNSTQSTEQHAPASRPAYAGHCRPGAVRALRVPRAVLRGGPGGRKFFRRKKVCKFCTEKIDAITYRDVRLLQGFVAERGKIVPRRLTGVCTRHQRKSQPGDQAVAQHRSAGLCRALLTLPLRKAELTESTTG